MTRTVTIKVRVIGQQLGCVATLCDASTGRKVAETTTVRPFGFTQAAYADGEALAERLDWKVKAP